MKSLYSVTFVRCYTRVKLPRNPYVKHPFFVREKIEKVENEISSGKDRPYTLPPGLFKPKQSLGQNFLSDQNYVRAIVDAFVDTSDSGRTVIEIGSGTGALTRVLFPKFPKMTAIEIDQRAVEFLTKKLPGLNIIHSDVLDINWPSLVAERGGKLNIIGNLPYYVTSQILFNIMDNYKCINSLVITSQLEFAQRVVAKPNTKEYGIPSVVFQLFSVPRMNFKIPPTVFFPVPKVDSALITLDMSVPLHPLVQKVNRLHLRRLLAVSFRQRRKMIRHSVKELVSEINHHRQQHYVNKHGSDAILPIELQYMVPERFECLRPEQMSPLQFVELTLDMFGEDMNDENLESEYVTRPAWRSSTSKGEMQRFIKEGIDLRGFASKSHAGDAHFFEETLSPMRIQSYLASNKDDDKVIGMKFLLASLSKGREISQFFPDVVKNVAVKNIEVKLMVYIYLVHYANYNDSCRDLALLSINTFQQDMNVGNNEIFRVMALRVLTSIRVPEIMQIQILAAKNCSTDTSSYARKCAATALSKLYAMDKEQIDSLKAILEVLLNDMNAAVLGAAVQTFNEICPNEFQLIHKHYRKLCHLIADINEWAQVSVLNVLTRYVRHHFVNPNKRSKELSSGITSGTTDSTMGSSGKNTVKKSSIMSTIKTSSRGFYSDEEGDGSNDIEYEVEIEPQPAILTTPSGDVLGNMHVDHQLVLKSTTNLLFCRASAVVLAVCSLHYYCGLATDESCMYPVAKSLIRILRSRREVQYVVLLNIRQISCQFPRIFEPFIKELYVQQYDSMIVKQLKLDILFLICTKANAADMLQELQDYVTQKNDSLVKSSLKVLMKISSFGEQFGERLLQGLVHLIAARLITDVASTGETVVDVAVEVARLIAHRYSESIVSHKTVTWLVKQLIISLESDGFHIENIAQCGIKPDNHVARTACVWLLGEFRRIFPSSSHPDMLRLLCKRFCDEDARVRIQIVNYAVKLFVDARMSDIRGGLAMKNELSFNKSDANQVYTLTFYCLEMCRYDNDVDCRDRARLLASLLGMSVTQDDDKDKIVSDVLVDDIGLVSKPAASGKVDSLSQLAELVKPVIVSPKPITSYDLLGFSLPETDSMILTDSGFTLGSLSSAVGHSVSGYNPLEDWASEVANVGREGMTSSRSSENAIIGRANQLKASLSVEDFYGEKAEIRSVSSDSSTDSNSDSDDDFSSSSDGSETPTRVALKPMKESVSLVMDGVSESDVSDSDSESESESESDENISNKKKINVSAPLLDLSKTAIAGDKISDLFTVSGPSQTPASTVSAKLPTQLSHDEIFASLMESFSAPQRNTTVTSQSVSAAAVNVSIPFRNSEVELISDSKLLIRPDVSSGLSVEIAYRRCNMIDFTLNALESCTRIRSSMANGVCAVIIIKNCREDFAIRRVRISFSRDIQCTVIDDVAVISPGQTIRLPLEINILSNIGKSCRLDARCDGGSFSGNLLVDTRDGFYPVMLDSQEFVSAISRFSSTSLNVTSRKVSFTQFIKIIPQFFLKSQGLTEFPSPPLQKLTLRYAIELFMIAYYNSSVVLDGAHTSEVKFVSALRRGMKEDRAYFVFTVDSADVSLDNVCSEHGLIEGTCNIYCDDALLCASLVSTLKSVLN